MKSILVGIMVLGFLASMTVSAEDNAATPAADKPAVAKAGKAGAKAMTEISVAGKISKEEPKTPGGKVKFVLTTPEGAKIMLPETKPEVADLEKFIGKDVKIVGAGKEIGKKALLKSITSVTEATSAPASAPASAPEASTPEANAPVSAPAP